jgi:hypothetical protein
VTVGRLLLVVAAGLLLLEARAVHPRGSPVRHAGGPAAASPRQSTHWAPPRFLMPTGPAPSPPMADSAERTTYFAALARAHGGEPIDAAWSQLAEAQLQEAAAEAPRGFGLGAIACRSTLCRVELAHADQGGADAQESFVGSVSALFSEVALDSRGPRTVAFLARAGHGLPAGGARDRDAEDGERATAEH